LSFINSERIGLVTVFSDETAPILFGGDVKSHLLAFISSDDAKFEDYMTNLKNTAKKFRGKVNILFHSFIHISIHPYIHSSIHDVTLLLLFVIVRYSLYLLMLRRRIQAG
jgi:hypothetical protein